MQDLVERGMTVNAAAKRVVMFLGLVKCSPSYLRHLYPAYAEQQRHRPAAIGGIFDEWRKAFEPLARHLEREQSEMRAATKPITQQIKRQQREMRAVAEAARVALQFKF